MLGILEETGLIVKASYHYLDIEELFDVWKHINHYFVCEYIEDTGKQHLTEAEKKAGCTFVWVSLDKAIELFAKYTHRQNND